MVLETARRPKFMSGQTVRVKGVVGSLGHPNGLTDKRGFVVSTEPSKAGIRYIVYVDLRGPMKFYEDDIERA